MVYLHLAWLAIRTTLFVGAALFALFAGYVGVERTHAGYVEARSAHDALAQVHAEQQAKYAERAARLEDQAELAAAARQAAEAAEDAAAAVQRAQDVRTQAIHQLSETRAAALSRSARVAADLQRLEQRFDLRVGGIPDDPAAFDAWVDRAWRRVEQICTVQWRDITELQRIQRYVAGNVLSDACGQRGVWFTQLRTAGAAWQAAADATASAEALLATGQAEVDALRASLEQATSARAAQERAAEEHAQSLAALDEELAELERRETSLERETGGATGWVAGLRSSLRDAGDWLLEEWRRVWPRIVGLFVALIAAPYVLRAVLYWVVAPLVTRARPLTFRPSKAAPESVSAVAHPSVRTARVRVPAGTTLRVRPDRLRQVPRGASRTRFFLPAELPLQSWVLGFFGWTEVEGTAEADLALTLAASGEDAADSYLVRVDLREHPGLVIHPQHVVAVSDGLELFARWRFAWHALAMGQLRYIQLRGTGTVWLEGYGDVVGGEAGVVESHQDASAYLGWDQRLHLRMCRRETAYPYLLGQVPLFELGVRSDNAAALYVWQKAETSTGRSPLERTAGAFLSALGKLLGF
jgi:predicted  nucleic acid-binding Zn-ribbon protein